MASFDIVPLSRLQTLNGRNLRRSLQESAQATVHTHADVDELARRRASAPTETEPPPVDPVLLKTTALALVDHPRMNAHLTAEGLCHFHDVDIGLMVARKDGVIVPVVRQAAQKSLEELSSEVEDAVARAQAGRMTQRGVRGATFTLVDLGRYDVDAFAPLLPEHTVGILGAGRIRPVCRPDEDGTCRPTHEMALSLTFDHRALHGVEAAAFLQTVTRRLAQPTRL